MLALSNHEKKGKHFIPFEEDMTSIVYTVIIVIAISVKPTLNFFLKKGRPSKRKTINFRFLLCAHDIGVCTDKRDSKK